MTAVLIVIIISIFIVLMVISIYMSVRYINMMDDIRYIADVLCDKNPQIHYRETPAKILSIAPYICLILIGFLFGMLLAMIV